MLDDVFPTLARVALVFGDADSAAHLRDAVSDRVQIVYETSAADFDVARLAAARARVALVNLDAWDWLETIESSLDEAGVVVVFNDPEISGGLEGWARARWLRHLLAKLEGHGDFDPPRPHDDASTTAVAEASASTAKAHRAPSGSERPLSPAEIESLTADFAVLQDVSPQAPGEQPGADTAVAQTLAGTDGPVETKQSTDTFSEAAGEPPSSASTAGIVADPPGGLPDSDPGSGDPGALDVDTEALSAMIDARLAQADGQASSEAPVWRVVEDDDPSTSGVAMSDPSVQVAEEGSVAVPAPASPVEDADVLKGLPALDDWELVDPEAPVAVADTKRVAAPAPDILNRFDGLELLPMEAPTPFLPQREEPAERWMHDVSDRDKPTHGRTSESKGDHA